MAALLYNYSFTTRMHDIDAAGVMFFARFFYHIHDAYEAFLNQQTHNSIQQILDSDIILPISHTEANYKAPVFLNETINIEIYLHKLDSDGFSLNFQLLDCSKKIRASAQTHHVCLSKNSRQRTELPLSMRQKLAHDIN